MVSAGWGPVTRQPSARKRLDRRDDQSISSRPSVPPSPAWGLSPATASRGSAIPKLRCSPRKRRPAARFDQRRRQSAGDLGRAAHGWSPERCAGVGPASIIATLPGDTPQRSATNSVWPGWEKPMRVELLLRHRAGDHRRGRARSGQADRQLERIERAMGAGDAGMAGQVGLGRRDRQDRQADVERAVGLSRIVDRRDRAVPHRGQAARIADRDERRQVEPVAMVPAFADDFGADPGGIAKRNRERPDRWSPLRLPLSGSRSPRHGAGRADSGASAG